MQQIKVVVKLLLILYALCLLFCFVFGLLNVTESIYEIKTILPGYIWVNIKETNEMILNDVKGVDGYIQRLIIIIQSGTLLFINNFSKFALVLLVAKVINSQLLSADDDGWANRQTVNSDDHGRNYGADKDENFEQILRQRQDSFDNSLVHSLQSNLPMPKLENELPLTLSADFDDILIYDENFGVIPKQVLSQWKTQEDNHYQKSHSSIEKRHIPPVRNKNIMNNDI